MRRAFSCLFFFLTVFLHAEEKLFIPFDQRIWKIGFESQTENEKILEFVLQNEDIMNWNELFTVQIFKNLPVSASDFISVLEKSSKKTLPPYESLQFKVLEKDPLNIFEIFFIFDHNQPPVIANEEYNLGRVMKGKEQIYYLRYSNKNEKAFKQDEENWIARFKLAYLASTSENHQKERWLAFSSKGVEDQGKPLLYQAEYQFIDNLQLGYNLALPKNWLFQKKEVLFPLPSSLFQESLEFFSPDRVVEGKVSVLDVAEGSSLQIVKHRYEEHYKKQYPQAKLVDQGDIQTVLGQKGSYFILIDKDKKGWITFMSENGRIYCLELWAKQEQFDLLANTLENIIMNFHIQH